MNTLDSLLESIFVTQTRVLLVVAGLLLLMDELGYRKGFRLFESKDEPRKSQVGHIQTALLGLLALLLGFTFSIAVGHYELRQKLVLQEANAIRTTYLCASFLPEADKTAVKELLRNYVDVRLSFHAPGTDDAKLAAAESESARLQQELWQHTVPAGWELPSSVTATFITALNDTIDLDAARWHALRLHLPTAVRLLVLFVAAAGCYGTGFGAGASGARTTLSNMLIPLLIAIVITLITDLDHPRRGLIGISQQPLLDLKQSIQSKTKSN
jgi:hypothetical protein